MSSDGTWVIAVFKRKCSVCGREMTITVFSDYRYAGGHYFGRVKWRGEEVEDWECDECYRGDP